MQRVKRGIEGDAALTDTVRARMMFELAVYGRAVKKMHPSTLTYVTCGFDHDQKKVFHAISFEVGREKRKLTEVR